MRENKHSKKLAFAVLAAAAAVGATVAPVSAAPMTTADGFIFAAGNATASPDAHNNVSYGVVANGTATSIAVGQGNTITSANGSSSAYGNQNTVNGNQANAFGDGNTVTGAYAQAFGDANIAKGTNAIAYGYNNTVDGTTKNYRDRTFDNEPDSATLQTGSWNSNSVAIGSKNTALGSSALAVGNEAKAKMSESVAIGHEAQADKTWGIAIGTRATASDVRSLALGHQAKSTGYKANAIGADATANGNHANAIGSSATATGDHAQAFGAGAQATGVRTNVFGSDAAATADYSIAIGNKANASTANSIALGADSTTRSATNVTSATVAGHTYGGFAGTSPVGSVSVGKAGQERQIHNVAAGKISADSTDAVNGSQLYSVANDLQTQINNSTPGQINNNITNLNNRVGNVEKRVNKVGAGSAALAALHPLDFNPDDKWTIAAGYGHYHNANSAALGAFYRPNEDTMFSVGGTVGTGESQLNAGVSIRLGKRSPESRSRVAMGREIAELNARLQDMENKYNNLLQILTPHAIDPSKTAEFPDVPRNHWAYQYISQLAGNGILVGYPDGTFKGDVKMTRYEFATMLYRALQNGAPIDDNMKRAMNEFGPELQNIRLNHFRVDRISGADNDRHKTERVRVNNEPKTQRDVYGSRINQ
ncbi:MAG: S-layer homology domain-containing protein [Veillonella sp.]|uniref:S-layer homology domain-containing protein n=1 Tax=Veillonella sp. TaxID=1926307 RepID=UPI001EC995F3|nr:S-layer homology domain-containing protein [Veillonella sp.]MBS6294384.1 S-layer homology domain-containing protein [Veillonella sp.]MDU0852642.1 S-layer homology domain-containing protein [Veillonella sp.]MDU0925502.1 S-layer homology domain-containing protein [Veillonella sp.]MDU1501855.1 S-layer homology domain-containing protein [Veillonella sp.]MDU1657662.1 S-layer homology domain-containing protein [Veillonella sp.]